jgi:hypothetical protein
MLLNIEQDGKCYIITLGETIGPEKIVRIVSRDDDGWYMTDESGTETRRLGGKHKRWRDALMYALAYMEHEIEQIIAAKDPMAKFD